MLVVSLRSKTPEKGLERAPGRQQVVGRQSVMSLKCRWVRFPASPKYQAKVTILILRPACHTVPAGVIGEAVPCRTESGCAAARTPTFQRDGEQQGANTVKHSLENKPHSSRCHAVGNAGPEKLRRWYPSESKSMLLASQEGFGRY